MTTHLLSLADLHSAAPGVLDVVFGPDGDFEGRPPFVCFLRIDGEADDLWGISHVLDCGMWVGCWRVGDHALDLRIPSIAARLAGLCVRALGTSNAFYDRAMSVGSGEVIWDAEDAHGLASLVLSLAPRIVALR